MHASEQEDANAAGVLVSRVELVADEGEPVDPLAEDAAAKVEAPLQRHRVKGDDRLGDSLLLEHLGFFVIADGVHQPV